MKPSSASSQRQRRDLGVYDFDTDEEAVEVVSERYANRLHSKLSNRHNCGSGSGGEAAADGIKDDAVTKYDFLSHYKAAFSDVEKPCSGGTSEQKVLTGVWDVDLLECNHDQQPCPIKVPDNNLGISAKVDLDETVISSSSCDEPGQMCIDESEDESLEQETDVIFEVDERSYTSSPLVTDSDIQENEGCSECPASENFMTVGNLVDDVTVVLSPDYVIYGSTYYDESRLTFTSDHIKLECSDASGIDDKLVAEWSNKDVIHIYCRWSGNVQAALVQLGLRSHIITGTDEPHDIPHFLQVKFAITDMLWLEKEHKIKNLSERYRDIWNSHSSDDSIWVDDAVDHSVFSSRDNFIETPQPFEDIIYPKGDPDAVSISRRDFELLQPATFINDTIIDFYIKYLENRIQENERHRFHFFNSFFYRKLVVPDKDRFNDSEGRTAFLRVRKWTRKVNIFEKDYIFIPVNFNLHWSLLVICHPREIAKLKDDDVEEYAKLPCILHMDSIKGSHSGLKNIIQSVRQEAAGALWNLSFDDKNREAIAAAGGVQALGSYIWEEWKERHPELSEVDSARFLNLRFVPLELPQQENSFDCGLFLLHYVELFLEEATESFNPLKVTKFSSFLNVDWFQPAEASLKHSFIRHLIYNLLNDSAKTPVTCRNNVLSASINPENDVQQEHLQLLPEECSPATLVSNDGFCQVEDTGNEVEFLQTSSCYERDKLIGMTHQESPELGNANAPLSSGTEQTHQPYYLTVDPKDPKDPKDDSHQLSTALLGIMVASLDTDRKSVSSFEQNVADTVSSHDLFNTITAIGMRDEDEKIGYVPDSPCSSSGRKFEAHLEDCQEMDVSKGNLGDTVGCDSREMDGEDDVDCKDISISRGADTNNSGDEKPALQDLRFTEKVFDNKEGCQEIACKGADIEHRGCLIVPSVELMRESCEHNNQPFALYPDIVITDDDHSSDDDLQLIGTGEEQQPHKRRRVMDIAFNGSRRCTQKDDAQLTGGERSNERQDRWMRSL